MASPEEAGAHKREADEPGLDSGRTLKRKKTVTWAEDDELELPLGPPAGSGEAAAAAAAAAAGGEPVVVLPADGLFDALSLDLLEQQEGAPAAGGEEALSRRQLLERRLARAGQLAALYESELWALLEELRLRHAQFAAAGRPLWKNHPAGEGQAEAGAAAAAAADAAAAGEGAPPAEAEQPASPRAGKAGKPRREPTRHSQRQKEAAAKAAEEAEEHSLGEEEERPPFEGPGAGLRTLWREQQRRREAEARAAERKAAGKKGDKASQQQQQQQAAAGKKQQPAAADKQPASPRAAKPGAAAAGEPQQQQAAADAQQQQGAQPPAPLPPQPRFEDVEALILSGAAAALPPVEEEGLVAQRRRFVQRLELLGRLEQGALAATCRELDALGGLAVLCGRRRRYVLRRPCVALGRASGSQGQVDVDLAGEAASEAAAHRVSRHQAQLWLEADGGFRLRCTGRRPMRVNGAALAQGATAPLPTLSHVAVGGVSLLFVANVAAAARAAARAAQPAA